MVVRTWTLQLEQPAPVVAGLAVHLDPHEAAAAAARTSDAARRRYSVAHGSVREILGDVIGVDPATIRFDRRCRHCGDTDHGKPAVTDMPGLSFSVAHSGSMAVVAISARATVGVDVEIVRRRASLDRLAARVLAPAELAGWQALPDVDRLVGLLRAWTAKEAYLKAIGLGLAGGVRTAPRDPPGWSVQELDLGPAAIAMLAVAGNVDVEPVPAPWAPEGGVTLALER